MAIDWTQIYNKYKGLWVALAEDEQTVVGAGKTAKEALAEAKKSGHTDPILSRLPEQLIPYVGFQIQI